MSKKKNVDEMFEKFQKIEIMKTASKARIGKVDFPEFVDVIKDLVKHEPNE